MNNALNSAIHRVAYRLSVDPKLVESVYKSYWRFIKEQVASFDLKEMDMGEFNSVDTNFNLPYIGKLYVGTEKMEKYKRRKENFKKNVRTKENKANGLSGTSD